MMCRVKQVAPGGRGESVSLRRLTVHTLLLLVVACGGGETGGDGARARAETKVCPSGDTVAVNDICPTLPSTTLCEDGTERRPDGTCSQPAGSSVVSCNPPQVLNKATNTCITPEDSKRCPNGSVVSRDAECPTSPGAESPISPPSEPTPSEPTRSEPPPGPVASGTANVTSDPPGATVTLTLRRGGTKFSGVTPWAPTLPDGEYDWTVQRDGYLADTSSGAELFIVEAGKTRSLALRLTPASASSEEILQDADRAFNAGQCAGAIALYERMQRPTERTGQVAERWAASRVRLAQCARRVGDFDRAIEGYDAALSIDSRNWQAKFERGQSLCDARGTDLDKGIAVMQELSGQYINQFGRGTQGVLRALSDYGIGYCQYIVYNNAPNKPLLEDLRETIKTRFNMFTDRYERLTGDASSNADLPRGAVNLLQRLATDADRKLKSL
jgi:hypothetical protein